MSLEERKQKLAKLKENREKREEENKKQQHGTVNPNPENLSNSTSDFMKKTDFNSLLNQILNEPTLSTTPSKDEKSTHDNEKGKVDPVVSSHIASSHKKKRKLEHVSFVGETIIEPMVKYDKNIQVEFEDEGGQNNTPNRRKGTIDEKEALPQKSMDRKFSKVDQHSLETTSKTQSIATSEIKKEYSTEELKTLYKSKNFQDFFEKSTKMIEKALASPVDDLETMIINDSIEDKEELKDIIRPQVKFFDSNYTSNRVVTALEWSPNINDLLLAAYSQNDEGNINDALGVVLLWSLGLKSRPEFYCFCQSPVTAACFYPYSNNLIIGGLYSGQIVIWDLRTKTAPVQKTTMSSGGHAYPIYSMAVIGSQNAHNIVSISNDGKLCVWTMNMLSNPQKTIELVKPTKTSQTGGTKDINVTSMQFPEGDPNNFYIGSEEGHLYLSQLHGNQGKNENIVDTFEGHQAPITSLSVVPNLPETPPALSGLVLSSSFDWSVKLWNPRRSNECMWTFENGEDYIYDVCWNSVNPTLFASVDGEGYIDLWDCLGDLEVPLLHYKTDSKALNKAKWNKDGSKLLTGDSLGSLEVFSVDKKILKYNPEKVTDLELLVANPRPN